MGARIFTALLTCFVTLMVSASVAGREQSLAEAAQTEAARRQGVATPSKVYGNADAKRRETATPPTADVRTAPAGKAEEAKAPKRGSVLVATVPPADHVIARPVGPLESELPRPQSLCVSPAFFTLMAGHTRTLRLADELGRARSGGSWTTSDAGVATIDVIAGVVTVHGTGAGDATFTVNRDGLVFTGKMHVVSEGAILPNGTTLWSLGPC